jgi:hypothetical protein
MGIQKMSLANMQGKLSRAEMKNIMAGVLQQTECKDQCVGNSDCILDFKCKDSMSSCGTYIKVCMAGAGNETI